MRRAYCFVLLACLAMIPAASLPASPLQGPEYKLLKQTQRNERRALKMRERVAAQAMRGQHASRAERAIWKHQMQREERALREKQKDQLQKYKDQERVAKENQKLYGQ